MRTRVLEFAAAFLLGCGPGRAWAARVEELSSVQAADGTVQRFLVSYQPQVEMKAVAILFPDSDDPIGIYSEGDETKVKHGDDYLVRARGWFVENGVAVALLDAPFDHKLDAKFRMSDEQAAILRGVFKAMRGFFPEAKRFLVGIGAGAVSAAYGAKSLGRELDGVILISAPFLRDKKKGPGISKLDLTQLLAPVLLMHHRRDRCPSSPFREAARWGGRLDLVSVEGGLPGKSKVCGSIGAHGLYGRERDTAAALSDWMLGNPYPQDIR